MTRCLIALGGNVGVSQAIYDLAMSELEAAGIHVTGRSTAILTRPVGHHAGDTFWNAAATLEYDQSADQLLQLLHEIEAKAGRTRTIHWGPRTLDLDLCLFGDEVIEKPHLVVPHPAMWYRRFVLDPATEIAGDMLHPILQQTVRELWTSLHRRPLRMELKCDNSDRDIFRLPEILNVLTRQEESVQWCLNNEPRKETDRLFATVVFEKTPHNFRRSQQPRNSKNRSIRVYADTQDEALSQLPLLRSAIFG